ncbi:TolC family protein [Sphingobacterium mizutaii]|uniref:TolC family protein n=1 Tax=Sphingobacterium mizutaii TaxID=1010 RepID=UPI0028993A94|nr:TolC family protein [Sphingobacterium mizutaii]
MGLKFKSLLILLGLFIAMDSHAQSLQDLWDKTRNYYKGFEVQKQQILLAKQDSIAQQIKYKPQVQAQFQQGFSSVEGTSGAFLPLPGIMNISGPNQLDGASSTFNHFLSGSMNWDLINFGRKGLDKDISSTKIDYTKLKEQDFTYTVQQKLTRRYIEFLFFQVMDDWYQKHSERYQSIVDITKGLARAGIVPGADTLLATSSLKNVESNLLQIQGKLNGAKILLKEFTNEEVLSAGNNNPEAFLQLIGSQQTSTLEHPLLMMKRKEEESLTLLERKQGKELFPRVMLLGGLANRSSGVTANGYVHGNYGEIYNDFANNYFVGVGVTWNLQDMFRSKSDKKQYNLKLQNNLFEQELLQNEISSNLNQLNAEISAAADGIKESNISRQQAEDAYQLYKARYEGGLINLSELLQVQEILLQTERQNLTAYLNYWNLMVNKSYQQADFSQLFTHF